jgi:hypothetical protein
MNRLIHAFYALFIYDEHGNYSHTRFWSSIAYAVASWVIIELTLNKSMSAEYLFTYMAILATHNGASKWINNRFAINNPTTATTEKD